MEGFKVPLPQVGMLPYYVDSFFSLLCFFYSWPIINTDKWPVFNIVRKTEKTFAVFTEVGIKKISHSRSHATYRGKIFPGATKVTENT